MIRISKFKLRDGVLEKVFDLFFKVVGERNSRKEFNDIIENLLTPVERIMIAKRIGVMYLILRKIDQRSISDTLKVSTATVSRCSLIISRNNHFKKSLQKIARNKKISLLFVDIFNAFRSPSMPTVNWTAAQKRKYDARREIELGV